MKKLILIICLLSTYIQATGLEVSAGSSRVGGYTSDVRQKALEALVSGLGSQVMQMQASLTALTPPICSGENPIWIWDGTNWQCGEGGASSTDDVIGGRLVEDCESSGGTAVDIGQALPICQFAATSCPSGWSQYGNWSKTTNNACSTSFHSSDRWWIETVHGERVSCSTGGHNFSDKPQETCSYVTSGTNYRGGETVPNFTYGTCRAIINNVGCF